MLSLFWFLDDEPLFFAQLLTEEGLRELKEEGYLSQRLISLCVTKI